MMKKLFLVACVLVFVCSAAFASVENSMLFMWKMNDPDVHYFRYRVDDGLWVTVGTEQRDSFIKYTKDEDHTFTIEQSYDGSHWGDPKSIVFSEHPREDDFSSRNQFCRLESAVTFVPFETYLTTRAHGNNREYRSIYAAGLEFNAVGYLQERFGLGVVAEGTFAYLNTNSRKYSLNYAAYGIAAIRLVSHSNFEIVVELGFGAQFEDVEGKLYMAPSALLQLDSALKVTENLSLSINPSLAVSYSDFNLESDYLAYNIHAIAIGLEYKL